MPTRLGILFLISGPSGSGKTTLCRRLFKEGEAIHAISCTTRNPRAGEKDGVHYFFLSNAEFEEKRSAGAFLEHAKVHGNHYGTLQNEVLENLIQGVDVIMDIDVQGAQQVRKNQHPIIKKSLVDLFIMPPSTDELRNRLTGRGTDSNETINIRMQNSLEEMKCWSDYTYRIISGTHPEDYASLLSLLYGERLRVSRQN